MSARGPKATILAVDDDAVTLRLLSRILTQEGYRVVECGNIREARMQLQDGQFSVVITDLHMPGGSGLELARELRASSSGMPILLLSGSLAEDIEREARDLGRMECLSKPLDQERLLEVLQTLIGDDGAADEGPLPG